MSVNLLLLSQSPYLSQSSSIGETRISIEALSIDPNWPLLIPWPFTSPFASKERWGLSLRILGDDQIQTFVTLHLNTTLNEGIGTCFWVTANSPFTSRAITRIMIS